MKRKQNNNNNTSIHMKEKVEKGKQPLMSGISILTAMEMLLAFALICISAFSIWAIIAKGAIHQIIIAIPSFIVAAAIIMQQKKAGGTSHDA